MISDLPTQAEKYFWGDNLAELNWPQHKQYIVKTLLEKGDLPALKWLGTKIGKSEVKALLPTLNLQPRSAHFWHIYLA